MLTLSVYFDVVFWYKDFILKALIAVRKMTWSKSGW